MSSGEIAADDADAVALVARSVAVLWEDAGDDATETVVALALSAADQLVDEADAGPFQYDELIVQLIESLIELGPMPRRDSTRPSAFASGRSTHWCSAATSKRETARQVQIIARYTVVN